MIRSVASWIVAAGILSVAGFVSAQTTTAPGIDVEIYNPADGGNRFCVAPGETFWAHVWVRPGPGALTCARGCSSLGVAGGSAHLAAGVVDVVFGGDLLSFIQAQSHAETAAADGLIQDQNLAAGRIGWALAGDWIIDGDPESGLLDPCEARKLDSPDWVVRLELEGVAAGITGLHLRRPSSVQPFALSFADACGNAAFTPGDGIDEVRDAAVLVSSGCAGLVFFDGFSGGDAAAWSRRQGTAAASPTSDHQ